jgi:hypothetical protein
MIGECKKCEYNTPKQLEKGYAGVCLPLMAGIGCKFEPIREVQDE